MPSDNGSWFSSLFLLPALFPLTWEKIRTPGDNSRTKDRLSYWTWLAQIAERGKISCIFFADAYGELEVYQGKADAQYKGGNHVAKFEPTLLVPAMAAVTKSVGFGITGSTSYIPPYRLVRDWSTLDHLTEGRIGEFFIPPTPIPRILKRGGRGAKG
jgi:alkanesulfonate monooxygenase SsuD/methylene tetrahydromethanopterin reductase-like flavin-dependent oxidoreductase (luciferase family)